MHQQKTLYKFAVQHLCPLIGLKMKNSKLSIHHANILFPPRLEQSVLEAFTQ